MAPFNGRRILAPIAALTMAGIFFVYARSSVYAAKRNAQKHREADGGQISWRNEMRRQHGQLERPEDQQPVRQLLLGVRDGDSGSKDGDSAAYAGTKAEDAVGGEEDMLRARIRKGKRGGDD